MGNNLFNVEQADGKELLVELPAQFRSTFWIKRGGYVVVDSQALAERENKLHGEIVNVVREERIWRKMEYWYVVRIGGRRSTFSDIDRPDSFSKEIPIATNDEEDDSRVGKMPPSDSE
jgi:probable RNA-binding protein EIF1AD